jgi:hypothetical protein
LSRSSSQCPCRSISRRYCICEADFNIHDARADISFLDDFPKSITDRPILTAAKTTFTTSEDVNRQVSESLSTGLSLYELDADGLSKLKPDVVVTQVTIERSDLSP